ncbi:MAG: DUF3298 domain-containing protein [Pyrinomonadaceae bacterium]
MAENTLNPQSSSTPAPTPSPHASNPKLLAGEIKFVSKSVNEHVTDFYKMEVEYPQIEGLESKHARTFNRWVEKFVLSDVAEFRGLERAAMRKEKSRRPPIEESLDMSYEIIFANRDLISIKFSHEVMALGQTHPIDYPVPVNYDLKIGKLLKLGDVFKPKANYLEGFSRYCRAELKEKYTDPLMFKGTEPKAENYQNWNITPEGIMISFDDYQVGPHSTGQPVLIIPYPVLKDLISRDSAVNSFLDNDS